jgi:predicted kinase
MRITELFTRDMNPNWEVFEKAFPEMASCHHSNRWHKCGSPLNHTKLVVDEILKHLNESKNSEHYLILVVSAMLHDVGKIKTTYWNEKENDWCCKSHGEEGAKMIRDIFQEEDIIRREKVIYMVRYHMLLHYTPTQPKSRQERDLNILSNGLVPFEDMLLLNECDMRGSINEENTEENISKHIDELWKIYDEYKSTHKNKWGYVNELTPKMYVMIGVPGSGKSTFAKETLSHKGMFVLPIISRDKERIKMGLCGNNEKCVGNTKEEDLITKIVDEQIKDWLGHNTSFIIDNTSLKKKYREVYTKYAKEYYFEPIFVYVEAPSLNDNFLRRKGVIDKNVIQNMWNNMEFPTKDECSKLIVIKQHDNGEGDSYPIMREF